MTTEKKKRTIKSIAVVLLCFIAAVLLTLASYLIYLYAEYDRIEDNLSLQVENPVSQKVQTGTDYTAVTYNIGFGAYSPEFSFFLDTATTEDGKEISGKHAKAFSQQEVIKNTNGVASLLGESDADFVFLQEVDKKGHRSRMINQHEALMLDGYTAVFAENFHSAYLFYPLHEPIGKSLSGIMTLSRFRADSAVRRSLPIATNFSKFFDLDRCISITRLPVEGSDKQLVLINVHLSAYDTGGVIRQKQTDLFFSILSEESQKGNYVLTGGDFNHLLRDTVFPTTMPFNTWAMPFPEDKLPEGFAIHTVSDTPTSRTANTPYVKGQNFTCIIDGFIASSNISVNNAQMVAQEFEYSDHNPVKISFTLN